MFSRCGVDVWRLGYSEECESWGQGIKDVQGLTWTGPNEHECVHAALVSKRLSASSEFQARVMARRLRQADGSELYSVFQGIQKLLGNQVSCSPVLLGPSVTTPNHCRCSLAHAELFITLAILFRPGAPKLKLYHTDESDVYPAMDLFTVAPKADSKGVRVTVE